MPERIEVVFDSSTESPGTSYVAGDAVRHDGKTYEVELTRVKQGTEMIAVLAEILYPTEEQMARAREWERRSLGLPES